MEENEKLKEEMRKTIIMEQNALVKEKQQNEENKKQLTKLRESKVELENVLKEMVHKNEQLIEENDRLLLKLEEQKTSVKSINGLSHHSQKASSDKEESEKII